MITMTHAEALKECLLLENKTNKELTFSITGNGEEYVRSRVDPPSNIGSGVYQWQLTEAKTGNVLFAARVKSIEKEKDDKPATSPKVSASEQALLDMMQDMRRELSELRKLESERQATFYDKMLQASDDRVKSFFAMQKGNHEFLMEAQKNLREFHQTGTGADTTELVIAKSIAEAVPDLLGLLKELKIQKAASGGGLF